MGRLLWSSISQPTGGRRPGHPSGSLLLRPPCRTLGISGLDSAFKVLVVLMSASGELRFLRRPKMDVLKTPWRDLGNEI
ncbi:hypothetical protein ACFX1X_032103 [Malus domestica]